MKTLIVLIFFSIAIYGQNNSINCDSLISFYTDNILWKVPEVVGGLDSLQLKLIYPEKAKENKIEGRVYVLAIIDTIGNEICSKVIKGLGYGCDEEALRLVKTSKYYPGLTRDKPTTALIVIPIIFSLKEKKE
jgi:protein TonB